MTDDTQAILISTAATIAFVHTLIGVDHSLPFVVLGRARGWSLLRVLTITFGCGLAHVGSSVALGLVGAAVGSTLDTLTGLEAARGELSAWLLIGFGALYMLHALWSGRPHRHLHVHADGSIHSHDHNHTGDAHHRHVQLATSSSVVWSLFLIFVLGPCEPLIPLLLAPISAGDWSTLALTIAAFGGVTISTMLGVVALGHHGARFLRFDALEAHVHKFAGAAIVVSGVLVKVFAI